jgi:hypothetical protein
MAAPSENETWLIEIGDAVIRKEARSGATTLLPWEKLVYCLWVADYGMRNAGDLDTAADVYSPFQSEGTRLATDLSLPRTREAFSLTKHDLENQYFDRFEEICKEIKAARPVGAVELPKRRTRRKKE